MLRFPCPSCGSMLKAREEAGPLTCPACKVHVLAPVAKPSPASTDDDVVTWLEDAPPSVKSAAVTAAAATEIDDDMYLLSPLEPSPMEAAARGTAERPSEKLRMLAETPARERRPLRPNAEEPASSYDATPRWAEESNWWKQLSTAGLAALLAGLVWFIWQSVWPDYHYHVDEDTFPSTLEVHLGKEEASLVDTFKLGDAESNSLLGPPAVGAGSQTSQGTHGDWSPMIVMCSGTCTRASIP